MGEEVVQVVATDEDSGVNSQLVYTIVSGNERGFFIIESRTGRIRVNKELDLETISHSQNYTYRLTVVAADQGTPVARNNSVLVTIEVQSVNEHPPILLHGDYHLIKLSETSALNSTVLIINASDSDSAVDGELVFVISKGNNLGTFSIDSRTGKTENLNKYTK